MLQIVPESYLCYSLSSQISDTLILHGTTRLSHCLVAVGCFVNADDHENSTHERLPLYAHHTNPPCLPTVFHFPHLTPSSPRHDQCVNLSNLPLHPHQLIGRGHAWAPTLNFHPTSTSTSRHNERVQRQEWAFYVRRPRST